MNGDTHAQTQGCASGDRRAQLVRLLNALNDGLPGQARRPLTQLGFVHDTTHFETCDDCLTNGFVSFGCPTCNGAGRTARRRKRDPYDTGRSLGVFGESARKHEAMHERDRAIARLEAQLQPPKTERELLEEANAHGEAWESARRRLREQFDVEALEHALNELSVVDPQAHRVLHAVHVYGWLPDKGHASVLCERGLLFVDARMPRDEQGALRELRVPPSGPKREPPLLSIGERNRRIRKLEREGATTQWLAAEFGLSVRQTNAIIAGESEAA